MLVIELNDALEIVSILLLYLNRRKLKSPMKEESKVIRPQFISATSRAI